VVQELTKLGYERAFHLVDGWYGWQEAGYPTEPKPPR